ncbi:MAG TPA: hypothetical protein VKS25_03515 [Solirubrobacteraceae bacterium]|nr:hypothetical protein [Solirubrobacteraceae bacterium]
MRARTLLLTVVLACAIAVPALAAGNGRRVVGNCTKSQVRPPSIIVACGDGNILLLHLKWTSFGGPSAHGSGDYSANDCNPNCAAGKFHSYPVRVALSKAMLCKDHYDDYQLASLTFTGRRPAGQKSASAKVALLCPIP